MLRRQTTKPSACSECLRAIVYGSPRGFGWWYGHKVDCSRLGMEPDLAFCQHGYQEAFLCVTCQAAVDRERLGRLPRRFP